MDIVFSAGGITVDRKTLETVMKPGNWYSDNVVDAYIHLLQEHVQGREFKIMELWFYTVYNDRRSSIYTFKFLMDYKNWLFPCIFDRHFALIHINTVNLTVYYYDSYFDKNTKVLDNFKDILARDHPELNFKFTIVSGIPKQKNGDDCGPFVCHYAALLVFQKKTKLEKFHILKQQDYTEDAEYIRTSQCDAIRKGAIEAHDIFTKFDFSKATEQVKRPFVIPRKKDTELDGPTDQGKSEEAVAQSPIKNTKQNLEVKKDTKPAKPTDQEKGEEAVAQSAEAKSEETNEISEIRYKYPYCPYSVSEKNRRALYPHMNPRKLHGKILPPNCVVRRQFEPKGKYEWMKARKEMIKIIHNDVSPNPGQNYGDGKSVVTQP
uniref:Ubiquitin-like protease family profile domain-containing protein n=1 Tax=Tetranychus urticae TaxID=32264 RepID=T1K0J1_TETUR